ncbi:DJ-1/PfpI family protein [bacterium]|nr:DJ-1/PfpI family protein [bacterium]
MKHLLLYSLISIGIFFSVNLELQSQESKKVLLLIRDGSGDLEYTLKEEVGVMLQMLEQSGLTVVIATVSGQPLITESVNITPDLKLIDVETANYSGFILPCMHAGFSAEEVNPQAVKIVKEAVLAEKPIAVQHAAIIILAKAGLLKGINYTFHVEVDVLKYPEFNGSIYSGTGVVRYGYIITSGIDPYLAKRYELEDGTKELTRLLIESINEKTQ